MAGSEHAEALAPYYTVIHIPRKGFKRNFAVSAPPEYPWMSRREITDCKERIIWYATERSAQRVARGMNIAREQLNGKRRT